MKVGDISKEIDSRVKDAVSEMRGKDEYEIGDLTQALDSLAKDLTCELTGKEDYEVRIEFWLSIFLSSELFGAIMNSEFL